MNDMYFPFVVVLLFNLAGQYRVMVRPSDPPSRKRLFTCPPLPFTHENVYRLRSQKEEVFSRFASALQMAIEARSRLDFQSAELDDVIKDTKRVLDSETIVAMIDFDPQMPAPELLQPAVSTASRIMITKNGNRWHFFKDRLLTHTSEYSERYGPAWLHSYTYLS